jgi:mannose-6-phosphate isomerase-like protein (cupin superfamily)
MPSISPAFLKAQGVLRRIPARAIYERWNLCLGRSWHRLPEAPQRDEVYYVASGRAKMMLEFEGKTKIFDVGPGIIIFVPALVHHSSYDITEKLSVLVFFAPADGSKSAVARNIRKTL